MAEYQFSQQDIDISKKLHQYIMAGVLGALGSLNSLYQDLRLGGGFFKGKKMDFEIERKTTLELIGYVAAVLTILLENLPSKPENLEAIKNILDGALFDAQEDSSNPKPLYLEYLRKRGDNALMQLGGYDMTLFSVHGALSARIIGIWPVMDNNPAVIEKLSQTFEDINKKIETGLKNLLNETFPSIP